jgi:hypothetical protein
MPGVDVTEGEGVRVNRVSVASVGGVRVAIDSVEVMFIFGVAVALEPIPRSIS